MRPMDGPGLLRSALPRRRLAGLGLLALGASASEGLGLLMLVPLLAAGSGQGAVWRGLELPLAALLGGFVALAALRALLVQALGMALLRLQTEVSDALRLRYLSALLHAGWRSLAGESHGAMLGRLLAGADRAGIALQYLVGVGAALATLAAMLGAALVIAPGPALMLGGGGMAVLALYAGLRRHAAREGAAMGQAINAFYGSLAERLGALRLIKSFGAEPREAARAASLAAEVRSRRIANQRGVARGQVVLQAGGALVLAAGCWLALKRWQMPLAELLPLVALFARAVPLFGAVQTGWQQWAHAAPALDELAGAIAQAEDAAEPLPDGEAPVPQRAIALKEVTLRHPGRDRPALAHVSLELPQGSLTFVTGPSGAGKSTLADVLGGLVSPDAGALLIDGVPLPAAQLSAWRRRVAYVEQEPLLFDASLRENLRWAAPDADDAALLAALEAASAGFVHQLPEGLDTPVGPSGRQLSGGERQRIVLARALLRAPVLLILDEATSALDAAHDAAIAQAVAQLKGRLTILVIGHRGALSGLADQALRIEQGRLVTVAQRDMGGDNSG